MKKWVAIILFMMIWIQQVPAEAYVMTYMYGGTTATYKHYIDRVSGLLDTVCADYFDIVEGGALSCPKLSHELVNYAHDKGLSVIAMISNHWDKDDGIAALNNTAALTDEIASKTYEYNLDGVNVDIQNVTELHKDRYTEFVRQLRRKLPDREVSVAVAANPNAWTQGWHGSYDYRALSETSDYLMVMAYDESWYGSQPGPVASYSFSKRSIDYALKYAAANRVVLGVPLYGRYWKNGNSVGGNAITQNDIESLMQNYNFTKEYLQDGNIQSNRVTVTIRDTDIKPRLWGGTTLDAGIYTIYYDSAETLRKKLELARSYGLRGIGNWAVGQEHESVWAMYADYLSTSVPPEPTLTPEPTPSVAPGEDKVFKDITGHWAQSHIIDAYEKGWVQGRGNGYFYPNQFLTRAEAAAIIVRVSDVQASPVSNDFMDTGKHWAREDIASARYSGIVQGYGNMFYPDAYITREAFCSMVSRTFYFTKTVDYNNNPFTDISKENNLWSYDAVIELYENGILSGYPDRTFRPGAYLSRAEMAAVISRLSGTGTKRRTTIFKENNGIEEDIILPR